MCIFADNYERLQLTRFLFAVSAIRYHFSRHWKLLVREATMADVIHAALIRELTRDVVGFLRPEELLLVDPLASVAAAGTRNGLRAGKRHDEALGVGLSEVVALVTPAVVVAVTAAVNQAAGDMGQLAARGGEKSVTRFFGRLFRRGHDAGQKDGAEVAKLTIEQMAAVHRLAFARARKLGLSEDKAILLADSLAGSLALPQGSPARVRERAKGHRHG
jgi:hypothetical protein